MEQGKTDWKMKGAKVTRFHVIRVLVLSDTVLASKETHQFSVVEPVIQLFNSPPLMDRMAWLSNAQTVPLYAATASLLVQKEGRRVRARSGAAHQGKVVDGMFSQDLPEVCCSVKAETLETVLVGLALFEQGGARVDEGNVEDVMAGVEQWEFTGRKETAQ